MIEEIVGALKAFGNLKMISYSREIEWLQQLPLRMDADDRQKNFTQAAITAMGAIISNERQLKLLVDEGNIKTAKELRAVIAQTSAQQADALCDELFQRYYRDYKKAQGHE